MATEPGSPDSPNEDWVYAGHGLVVVLDGATVRTETGCVHGTPWYVMHLGLALVRFGIDRSLKLGQVLMNAIAAVADEHPECDLSHPGTPSAAVGMMRVNGEVLEYIVLGDVTVVVETEHETQILTDDRVEGTARAERDEANRHPIGSPEKRTALVRMKHAELAIRNQPGGYWVAASDPMAAVQSMTGDFTLSQVRQADMLTDGAARVSTIFTLLDWAEVSDLLRRSGPQEVIRRVRAQEAADPDGLRWARNKTSDDASIVHTTVS